ncbi:MAG: L,D-transpeptidase [Anaerolineales bacterium]
MVSDLRFTVREHFYVPSHAMRLVPNEELTPLSPQIPDSEKRIVVDLAAQMVTAFEGETLVFSQRCSSGAEGTETPTGRFRTYLGPSRST